MLREGWVSTLNMIAIFKMRGVMSRWTNMSSIYYQTSNAIYNGIFDSLKSVKTVPIDIQIWFDDSHFVFLNKEWIKVVDTLGNIKGVVSSEDRQLLKIALNLSDKDVDTLISDYKIEYNNHIKSSRPWGNEKWR